jgi:hypothetical protein
MEPALRLSFLPFYFAPGYAITQGRTATGLSTRRGGR